MKIRIAKITPRSFVDGPGLRSVVFLQGCPIGCPGCQNRHLWPAQGGFVTEAEDLATTLALLNRQVTISGGEPFAQPAALAALVTALRKSGAEHIILYTGYTWDQLLDPAHPAHHWVWKILSQVDVLVDGPFIASQDDPFLTYRGSRNQRPLKLPASLDAWFALGKVVVLDWDNPEIVLTPAGEALMPVGLAEDFAGLGEPVTARRCGQTR